MSEQDPTVTARAGKQAEATGPNKTNSTATVVVGCKLPHGLMLTLHGKPGEMPRTYRVKGSNSQAIVGGYGITRGVPRDFWEAWKEHHKHLDFVKNGLIFAHDKEASTIDHAKDGAGVKNGLEAIDPKKDLPEKVDTLEKDPV